MDTMTSHEKILAAIAIIQSEILARDSATSPEIFGTGYMSTSHLELAGRMLDECVGDLEYTMDNSPTPTSKAA